MESYDFKFKKGDIVIATRNTMWGDYSSVHSRICIILGTNISYYKWGANGHEYNLTYDLENARSGSIIDWDATDENIKLLDKYWYINDNLEVCLETDVKLDSNFIYRVKSFGVYLNEYEAKSVLYDYKSKNIIYNLIK